MVAIPFVRLISGHTAGGVPHTYVAGDRNTAITAAKNEAGTLATNVARYPFWPQLLEYENDNSILTEIPPSYVWDSVTTSPQTVFFAIASNPFAFQQDDQVIVDLRVFCDNAHDVMIELYDNSGNVVQTLTPGGGLTDGSLNPNTAEVLPFNWLNVRFYSIRSALINPAQSLQVVLSFQCVNYVINPPDSPNPAGLAFSADLYVADV